MLFFINRELYFSPTQPAVNPKVLGVIQNVKELWTAMYQVG